MSRAWTSHVATLLDNGNVLVTEGISPDLDVLNNTELYNPATGNWTRAGSLNVTRCGHNATLLLNGDVLLSSSSTDSTELYKQENYNNF